MGTSIKTFQIAINEIEKLTEERQALLSIIKKQEREIKSLNKRMEDASMQIPESNNNKGLYKLEAMMQESKDAMTRYTNNLRKEIDNAKSKQNKGK